MPKDILIVDDDKDILFTIKQILNIQDQVVFTAESGSACIHRIQQGFHGILLIDIMMPEMDGWDTIRELNRQGLINNVDIVVITARGTHQPEKMHGLESFITDYIPKPFDIDTIRNVISRLNQE